MNLEKKTQIRSLQFLHRFVYSFNNSVKKKKKTQKKKIYLHQPDRYSDRNRERHKYSAYGILSNT